ncbi:hypothetical protein [Novosphingobium umbonatum]|uniref:hypothetical protein n=1 Tax=Novosphingobium umbonatum TaxID=1908524 RepID=UPI001FE73A5C|nr:hypothetical protein [Novosphingobium umbonatum]
MNLKDKGSSALAVTMTRLWQDSANDLPMEDRLKALAHSLIAMANELGEAGQQAESHAHADRPAMLAPRARQDLGDLALRTYRERRRRNEIFADDTLFGEPAWDILLDLFVAGEKNKRVAGYQRLYRFGCAQHNGAALAQCSGTARSGGARGRQSRRPPLLCAPDPEGTRDDGRIFHPFVNDGSRIQGCGKTHRKAAGSFITSGRSLFMPPIAL